MVKRHRVEWVSFVPKNTIKFKIFENILFCNEVVVMGIGEWIKENSWLGFDLGIVFSYAGTSKSSNQENSGYKGLFSLGNVGIGFYAGPSLNFFKRIGPSFGMGLLIGQNGYIAGKIGGHLGKKFGGGLLFPIYPIYGVGSAEAMNVMANASNYLPHEAKYCMAIPMIGMATLAGYYTLEENLQEMYRYVKSTTESMKSYLSRIWKEIRKRV